MDTLQHLFSMRYFTIPNEGFSLRHAMCKGVSPRFVLAFTKQSLTNFTIWRSCVQAMCKGNSPALFGIPMSHSIVMRYVTISNDPSRQAMCKGVSPFFVLVFMLQPLLTRFTIASES